DTTCDNIDQDCSGSPATPTGPDDTDGDGYSENTCGLTGDCDDTEYYQNPGTSNPYCNCNDADGFGELASEKICDDYDNDCDGVIGEPKTCSCQTDQDCTNPKNKYCVGNECKECKSSPDCKSPPIDTCTPDEKAIRSNNSPGQCNQNTCSYTGFTDTPCTGNTLYCKNAQCVQCTTDSHCNDGKECTTDTCGGDYKCSYQNLGTDKLCGDSPQVCPSDTCSGLTLYRYPPDGNDYCSGGACQSKSCSAQTTDCSILPNPQGNNCYYNPTCSVSNSCGYSTDDTKVGCKQKGETDGNKCYTESQSDYCSSSSGWGCSGGSTQDKLNLPSYDTQTKTCTYAIDTNKGDGDGCDNQGWQYLTETDSQLCTGECGQKTNKCNIAVDCGKCNTPPTITFDNYEPPGGCVIDGKIKLKCTAQDIDGDMLSVKFWLGKCTDASTPQNCFNTRTWTYMDGVNYQTKSGNQYTSKEEKLSGVTDGTNIIATCQANDGKVDSNWGDKYPLCVIAGCQNPLSFQINSISPAPSGVGTVTIKFTSSVTLTSTPEVYVQPQDASEIQADTPTKSGNDYTSTFNVLSN
ncbi:MAG: hypothetical protein AABY14_02110, partial [Nanoarchaeota archaeon]